MKRTLFALLICFTSFRGFSQYAVSYTSLKFGAGLATNSNYNLGLTGGLEYVRGISSSICVGASLLYQSYNLYYSNDDAVGNAGATVSHSSSYIFFSPKIEYCIGRKGALHFYLSPGAGYNMSGKETTTKWNDTYGSTALGNYDSTLNTTTNIKKLVYRINFGLTEFIYAGPHWRVTFTEDLGFLASPISTTGTLSDDSRTPYTPQGGLRPTYLSLQLAIVHRSVGRRRINMN